MNTIEKFLLYITDEFMKTRVEDKIINLTAEPF